MAREGPSPIAAQTRPHRSPMGSGTGTEQKGDGREPRAWLRSPTEQLLCGGLWRGLATGRDRRSG